MFFEFSVDWEQEVARLLHSYQIVVPVAVIKELEMLAIKGTGEKKRNAKAAVKFVSRYETIETQTDNADEAVVEAAKTKQGVVFTNDSALRKHLRDEGVPVLLLRGRKKLALDE
jgi:rRNA-processing protein FCF1